MRGGNVVVVGADVVVGVIVVVVEEVVVVVVVGGRVVVVGADVVVGAVVMVVVVVVVGGNLVAAGHIHTPDSAIQTGSAASPQIGATGISVVVVAGNDVVDKGVNVAAAVTATVLDAGTASSSLPPQPNNQTVEITATTRIFIAVG